MELYGRYHLETNRVSLFRNHMSLGNYNLIGLENKVNDIFNGEEINLVVGMSEPIELDDSLVGVMVDLGFEIMTSLYFVFGFSKVYSTSQKSTNLDS